MKLDKIKFARLIGMITSIANRTLDADEIQTFDYVCDIEMPIADNKANPAEVDELMRLMAGGTQKLEAIKVYRSLTGAYLKEAKEAVEKYWVYSG